MTWFMRGVLVFCVVCSWAPAQAVANQYTVQFTAVYRGRIYSHSQKTQLKLENHSGGNSNGRGISVHSRLDPKGPGQLSCWYMFEISSQGKSEMLSLTDTVTVLPGKKLLVTSVNGWKVYLKVSREGGAAAAANADPGNYLLTTEFSGAGTRVPAKTLVQPEDTQGQLIVIWNGGASKYVSQWKTEKLSSDGSKVKLYYYFSLKTSEVETAKASVETALSSKEAAKVIARGKDWKLSSSISAVAMPPPARSAR